VGKPYMTPVLELSPDSRSLARNEANGSIGGAEAGPTQPASGLSVLFFFQGQSIDVGGRGVAKHQGCVGGIKPKPEADCSGKRKVLQTRN
jgi:hypothetical protein